MTRRAKLGSRGKSAAYPPYCQYERCSACVQRQQINSLQGLGPRAVLGYFVACVWATMAVLRREFLQLAAGALGAPKLGSLEKFIRSGRPVSEDLFILIPGIMGSELYVDGKPVWSPKPSAIFEALTSLGQNLQRLRISKDSDTDESLGDGVGVGRLIPDIHIVPGFMKIDGYSGLRKKLVARFSLQPGKNYHEFAYDWRRDNRAAARRLQKEAAKWLTSWRASGPSKEKAQLILIGHSMGGLVARYFLEALGGWENTRAFITFGAPYRGSVKALDYVSNGYFAEDSSLVSISELVRSFTSVYQLMPIYDCCSPSQGAKPGILTELPSVPNVEIKKAIAALTFHEELRDRAAENKENSSYRAHRYEFCSIIGIGQATPSQAVISPTGLKTSLVEGAGAGDGTVSRVSAEPPVGETLSSGHYVNEFHGSLQNNDAAWWELTGFLESLYLTPSRKFVTEPEDILKERIEALPLNPEIEILLRDACSAKDEFQCNVKRVGQDLKPTADVRVQSAVSGITLTQQVTLNSANQWQTVNFGKLDPGMYRCSASAREQIPGYGEKSGTVTDTFLVV
jgi:Lecithin:cholesterol acyltransferase